MAKVYIVTEGEYSDYRIVGVFDEKERAERVARLFGGYYSAEVEEWEVNDVRWGVERFWFGVRFNADGSIDSITLRETSGPPREQYSHYTPPEEWTWQVPVDYLYVQARDREHAKKVAIDKRAVMMAQGEWVC